MGGAGGVGGAGGAGGTAGAGAILGHVCDAGVDGLGVVLALGVVRQGLVGLVEQGEDVRGQVLDLLAGVLAFQQVIGIAEIVQMRPVQ